MSFFAIVGLFLWGIFILFGPFFFDDHETDHPITRLIAAIIVFPIFGVIFSVIGVIGVVMISPLLKIFGWSWFILPNF